MIEDDRDVPCSAEATLFFGNTVKSEHCLRYGGPCTGGPDEPCGECSGMSAVHDQRQRRESPTPVHEHDVDNRTEAALPSAAPNACVAIDYPKWADEIRAKVAVAVAAHDQTSGIEVDPSIRSVASVGNPHAGPGPGEAGTSLTDEQILAMDPRAQETLLGAVFVEVPNDSESPKGSP